MEEFCSYTKIYSTKQEQLISEEFKRLQGHYYLEHAGATLYSEKQIQNIFSQLSENLYANPHSRNLSSKLTEDAVDIVRYQILTHFNTNSDEYSVIFTSGATASLKIIGEYFSYQNKDKTSNCDGTFVYLDDNHTSAVGMREYAKNIKPIKFDEAFDVLSTNIESIDDGQVENNSLFVYPAQSNFSGTKYPLSWINYVKNGALNKITAANSRNWFVTLDAANYVGTNQLDLSLYQPDFVTISFYKMFGYPTGLGALLIKNSSAHVLDKVYFGGGTVLMILSTEHEVIPRITLHEKFEDGTLPFLSILAVKQGFDTINRFRLNFTIISQHVFSLAQYVYRNLLVLHHSNGNSVAELYHDTNFENNDIQGSIVNFNLLRSNKEYIGYSEVLHFSNLYGIHLRTGCFCNPGACQRFLRLKASDIRRNFKVGHVCGDQHDLVEGYPTGSVRISFGYMSTKEDADRFLEMIRTCFISKPIISKIRIHRKLLPQNVNQKQLKKNENINKNYNRINNYITNKIKLDSNKFPDENKGVLEHIFLYPIKSCGAFSVLNNWPITSSGLKYDRQWMIINSSGVCFTQKHNRRLCLIKPTIDLEKEILKLSFLDSKDICLPLNIATISQNSAFPCQSKVCGDKIQGWDCGEDVAEWLSHVLDCPGLRLLKQCDENFDKMSGRTSKAGENQQLSLANKAQYLLLNLSSVEWLRNKIPEDEFDENIVSTIHRFRPNFVVKFNVPFIENSFNKFTFNNTVFESDGPCTRCQMICIDQSTAKSSKEPLQTLSREFKGKIVFGVYLNGIHITENNSLSIGCDVIGYNS